MKNEIKIIRNYSFWKHPIKWWKDRKSIAVMNLLVNDYWNNGGRELAENAVRENLLYGTSIIKVENLKK